MDPLSLTLAIAPLAIEVASVARKVKNAVVSYKAAPDEVRSLAERLTMLEGICQDIELGLARQSSGGRVRSRNAVCVALALCREKLAEIDAMLAKFEAASKKQTRIRFVIEKGALKDICRDLDSLIQMLHLGLGVDLWVARTASFHGPAADGPGREGALVDGVKSSPDEPVTDEPLPSMVTVRSRRKDNLVVQRKTRHLELYHGLFGQVDYKQNRREIRGLGALSEGGIDQSSVVSLTLPLLPYRLDLKFMQSWLAPVSVSLNVAHVIDSDSALGVEIKRIFWDRDLPRLQSMLSRREISLYSVYDRTNSSLLHLAINYRWTALCRLLAQHDSGGKTIENFGYDNLNIHWCSTAAPDRYYSAQEILDMIVDLKRNDLTASGLLFMLHTFPDPEQVIPILKTFLRRSDENTSVLVDTAWVGAVTQAGMTGMFGARMFGRDLDSLFPRLAAWTPVFRELIRMGVDVHRPLDMGGLRGVLCDSAYCRILDMLRCPSHAENSMREWLEVLKDCGVHISTYLERERDIFRRWCSSRAPGGGLQDGRVVGMFDFEGQLAPTWAWGIDPQGPAAELLAEFSHIAHIQEYNVFPDLGCDQDDPFARRHSDCVEAEWPFRRSLVTIAKEDGPSQWHLLREYRPTKYTRKIAWMIECHQRRLDRQWAKRTLGKRTIRDNRSTMPGSWVE